ncbi:MAG TPA: dihydroneopterin aldolase, partial [Firmicutes bacterium]|nr:dihydroneopterin aldolase [Bacillota bacterium]
MPPGAETGSRGRTGRRDRLSLRSMTFWGYTGVHEFERQRGQRFEVDLDLYLDLGRAVTTDDLAETVDYGAVFTLVRRVVEEGRFRLLEALAGAVAEAVLAGAPAVEEVAVRVRKPQAPLPGLFETVEVEVVRRRDGLPGGAGQGP